MKYRSWLIVPGASEDRLGAVFGTGTDVVVIDLADTVPPEDKPRARKLGTEWLAAHRTNLFGHRGVSRWVRVNALDTGQSREDLATVMAGAPDGVILPRAAGPDAVRQLAAEIYELEQHYALPAGSTRIMPVVGETPLAAMRIADYLEAAHQRLCGLTWNASGLAAALGVEHSARRDHKGGDASRFVRAQTLLTAHAAHVIAIEAPFPDGADPQAVSEAVQQARSDGFSGMFAADVQQIDLINAAFTPYPEEVEAARAIAAAFTSHPHAVSLPLLGRMIDRSDLARAQRVLYLAETECAGGDTRRRPILRPA